MSSIQDHPLMQDLSRSVVQPRIITPMLGIFPGSTAAYTALEFMTHARELNDSDRKRIALIYIDTDAQPPELVAFREEHVGMFNEYIIRIGVPANIRYIPRVQQGGDLTEPHTYVGQKLPEYFANGARGVRNNGHVAACHDYQKIFDPLNHALDQISSREANKEHGSPDAIQVNISAFIGGGTASGIIADLACIVRELLTKRNVDQRINLLCMLPAEVSSSADIDLRKSNAVACLLEVMALGMAAKGTGRYYEKYIRANMQRLSPDPIASEVFLVGSAGLSDPREIARIIGLDLFHRTLDAASVGELERSKSVDRTTLGDTDDRGLPTMFGISSPLEVRFPAQETALAFAQIAASRLLPLLASYQPHVPPPSEANYRRWQKEWRMVGRIDANANDPLVVVLPEVSRSDFENLDSEQLEILWERMERLKQTVSQRVAAAINFKRKQELERIQARGQNRPGERIKHWQSLLQEYKAAFDDLHEQERPIVPERSTELENSVLNRRFRLPIFQGYPEAKLFDAYTEHLQVYTEAERHRQLEALIEELIPRVEGQLKSVFSWASHVNAAQEAERLRERGKISAAWRGRLDQSHPLQYHIFDLPMLCTVQGRNIAVEYLYGWATANNAEVQEDEIDYHLFLNDCINDLTGGNELDDLHRQSTRRLTQRVVDFFQKRYLQRFQDLNLFELTEHALRPLTIQGKSIIELQEQVFTEQLKILKKQMIDLVTFDERVGGDKCVKALRKQVFLGFHWSNGQQQSMLDAIADELKFRSYGEYLRQSSVDPHRIQISYGKHAISLSTIPDFYYDHNSAMERYQRYQEEWTRSLRSGPRPPHSSDAVEHLVTDPDALGYQEPDPADPTKKKGVALDQRLIRQI